MPEASEPNEPKKPNEPNELSADDGNGRERPVHLGDLRDLGEGQMRVFPDVGEFGIVVCRIAGSLHAVADNCSHREAKLSEGRLRGTLLTCPLHGARFDARTGTHQGPPASTPIRCFAVTETGDSATLTL